MLVTLTLLKNLLISRVLERYHIIQRMSGMPQPAFSSGMAATTASVVSNIADMDVAFYSTERDTLVGSKYQRQACLPIRLLLRSIQLRFLLSLGDLR